MGNVLLCMTKKRGKNGGTVSESKRGSMSKGRLVGGELLHREALALAIQQHELSQRFDNASTSRRVRSTPTSSRRRNTALSDPSNKQSPEFLTNVKTKKIVLVHGGGFGAWCWYKSIALLQETGLLAVALDLAGSGIDLWDTTDVTTMAEYSRPLIDYLQKLPRDEKVILVGHSSGGACVSHALEQLPNKISKAVYLCASMISDGQRAFDVFAEELNASELLSPESKSLIYGNGNDNPPTGFMFGKQCLPGLFFNQSPARDVALAMASMRPIPLAPMMEVLSLSEEKYGTGRRFYVQTLDDNVLSPDVQEKLVRENPPEGIFKIKGSDHCPFFSKPQALHKILLELAQIP